MRGGRRTMRRRSTTGAPRLHQGLSRYGSPLSFSWINTSGSKNHSSARIDHFMLSSDLLDYVEECELRPLRNKSSDHRPITLVLSKRL